MLSNGTKVEENFDTGGKRVNNGFGFIGFHYRFEDGGTPPTTEWRMRILFPATGNHPIFRCKIELGTIASYPWGEVYSKPNCKCGEYGMISWMVRGTLITVLDTKYLPPWCRTADVFKNNLWYCFAYALNKSVLRQIGGSIGSLWFNLINNQKKIRNFQWRTKIVQKTL